MDCYRVEIARSAVKDLRGIDRKWVPRLMKVIGSLEEEPRPPGCKKLVGSEHTYRVRVGDYRIVYEIVDDKLIVLVVRVRHRRDVYR